MSEFIKDYISKFKIFVFDVDDTLLYTFSNGFDKVCAAARRLGLKDISFDEFRNLYGVLTFEECIKEWFGNIDVDEFTETYTKMSSLYPYAPICDFSLIQSKLMQRGIECAILTNGHNDKKLKKKLQVAKVHTDRLLGIWGREDIEEIKPSTLALKPIKEIADGKGILYFADSYADYLMCKEANVGFVQVLSGKEERIEGCHCLDSVRDLVSLV